MNMAEMLKSASSSGAMDLSEVQDFSMPSKKSPSAANVHAALSSAFPSMGNKSKLDDTLHKLMKKNNCVSYCFVILHLKVKKMNFCIIIADH